MACLHDLSLQNKAALGTPRSAGSLAPGHGPCAVIAAWCARRRGVKCREGRENLPGGHEKCRENNQASLFQPHPSASQRTLPLSASQPILVCVRPRLLVVSSVTRRGLSISGRADLLLWLALPFCQPGTPLEDRIGMLRTVGQFDSLVGCAPTSPVVECACWLLMYFVFLRL